MVAIRCEDQLVVLVIVLLTLAAACGGGQEAPVPTSSDQASSDQGLAPDRETQPVRNDPDDPAFWLHPTDPGASLIIGTNKVAAPDGALVVFGLDGRIRQEVSGLDRPNNVDVEQGVRLGGVTVDLAVATERLQHRLRVFRVTADGLTDWAAIPVLEGESGDRAEPMGISLYHRPRDGALFAIVAPKSGPSEGYLWQYRLDVTDGGDLEGRFVRRFGAFSERGAAPGEAGEIEAIVVDDQLGYVYYADERYGIHKWQADPDAPDADRELAVFGLDGYERDREGLALYARPDGTGYLVSTDQVPGGSMFKLYARQGMPGAPHDHPLVAEMRTTADETDGIDVTSATLPGFEHGVLIAMNSTPRNFVMFGWDRLFGDLLQKVYAQPGQVLR